MCRKCDSYQGHHQAINAYRYLKLNLLNNYMEKKIGLFWLKDDFRLTKNYALIEATKNHDEVVAFYIFKQKKFKNQEAQRWWISKSLGEFRKKLGNLNINLEIIKSENYEPIFEKLFTKKNYNIYWNKTYEPRYLSFDKFLIKNFELNKIKFKIFKGNILNDPKDIKTRVENYSQARNFPSILGTSKLSPFIKHGQIHVETIWEESIKNKKRGINKFLAEIGWREFNHSLINNFPHMLRGNYSKKFDKFPWEKNSKFLLAWKKGLTGYPIVDAGMRELYSTGWMHNRVRMIVGSFLVKHLLINWTEGEKFFKNCLLDYNEANNISGWQWVAGCGADAAPYFRIFNPILQGEKFDKDGEYVREWVQELKNVPKKFIHKPWEIKDDAILKLGEDYPYPLVVHEKARLKALESFKKI